MPWTLLIKVLTEDAEWSLTDVDLVWSFVWLLIVLMMLVSMAAGGAI